jgi:hypothetical protein
MVPFHLHAHAMLRFFGIKMWPARCASRFCDRNGALMSTLVPEPLFLLRDCAREYAIA